MASVIYMSYCPSVHVITSIASIANTLCITKLLYNSTVSMVTDAIYTYEIYNYNKKIIMIINYYYKILQIIAVLDHAAWHNNNINMHAYFGMPRKTKLSQ